VFTPEAERKSNRNKMKIIDVIDE